VCFKHTRFFWEPTVDMIYAQLGYYFKLRLLFEILLLGGFGVLLAYAR